MRESMQMGLAGASDSSGHAAVTGFVSLLGVPSVNDCTAYPAASWRAPAQIERPQPSSSFLSLPVLALAPAGPDVAPPSTPKPAYLSSRLPSPNLPSCSLPLVAPLLAGLETLTTAPLA